MLALVLRFTIFLGSSSDQLFGLAIVYGGITWLPIVALNFVHGEKLWTYLSTHHPQKWEELRYVPYLGTGWYNGRRFLRWLYSKDSLGDQVLAGIMADMRGFIRFAITVFFSSLPVMPVLMGP